MTPVADLAVLAAASAAALAVGGRPRLGSAAVGRRPRPTLLVAGGAGLLVLVVAAGWVPGRMGVAAVVGGAVVGGVLALERRRRRRLAADAARARVLDVCQLLAAELAAGRPPGAALERAAIEWPTLQPVAAAYRLGGDVPSALRQLAARPGHGDLALVAAAWQVAHTSGGGLAAALRRLAATIRAGQATGRVVRSELASARATARLMAGLPVLALVMGGGIGGDPLGFLLATPVGLACLSGGLALELAGLWWIEGIAGSVAETG